MFVEFSENLVASIVTAGSRPEQGGRKRLWNFVKYSPFDMAWWTRRLGSSKSQLLV